MVVLWSAVALASSVGSRPEPSSCPARSAVALSRVVAQTTGAERRGAAICLLDRHPEQAGAAIEAWMADPEAADLAHLVADRFDTLPSRVAVSAATTGVRGPHADWVIPVVWRSEAHVRAVLAQDGVE